jgi:hypothetical protein
LIVLGADPAFPGAVIVFVGTMIAPQTRIARDYPAHA